MQYKKNFLKNVILVLEFENNIEINDNLITSFIGNMRSLLPNFSEKPVKWFESTFWPTGMSYQEKNMINYEFSFKNNVILTLNNISIRLLINSWAYENRSSLTKYMNNIDFIIEKLWVKVIRKIIMQYVNYFDFFKNKSDVEKYISENLLSSFNLNINNSNFLRQAILNEYEIQDPAQAFPYKLTLNAWFINPDYPNQIVNYDYNLVFTTENKYFFEYNKNFITEIIDKYNNSISEFFENSIKSDLRNYLNEN